MCQINRESCLPAEKIRIQAFWQKVKVAQASSGNVYVSQQEIAGIALFVRIFESY